MEELELVCKAQEGDFQAFEKLVILYKKRIFSFAYFQVKNKADAEDISQEVFWRVFNYIKKYNPSMKFFNWIYTIEMNVIKSFYKSRKQKFVDISEEFLENIVFNNSNGLTTDDKIVLFQAMDQLDQTDRNILFLKYIDDRTIKEIAEAYLLSEENVKVKIFRAKEKVLKWINGGERYEQK